MTPRTLVAGLLALAASALATAATIEERSPFAQGHWWNPSRAGNGFEMFNVGKQVMVIWYTYDDAGKAIWYTAQGNLIDDMPSPPWPLLRHRWENGRKVDPAQAGTLKVTLNHAEGADISWDLNGKSGTWPIVPFIVSGIQNEVDHTGSWFDPANSGWGFTLTEQGDVMGGVLFTYDTSGAPTWAAGFGRERNAVELFTFEGACPSCNYRPSTSKSVGRVAFDFAGEWAMGMRNLLSLPMAQGVRIDTRMLQLSRPASSRTGDRQLANFASQASFKAFLDAAMLNVAPYYGSPNGADFSAAPPAPSFSPTNLITAGVDEAGLVKTDGRYVYTFSADANGSRQPVIRVAQISDEGAGLAVRANVALSGNNAQMGNAGLYLAEDKLVSVTGPQPNSYSAAPWISSSAWSRGVTRVEMFSLATPERPASTWLAEIDGYLVASRRIGDRLYLITRYVPYLQGFVYGALTGATFANNRALLAATPLSGVLPKIRVNNGNSVDAVSASAIFAPPLGSRPAVADMVIVTAIDLKAARVSQSLAIVGSTETIYASAENLYLATSRTMQRSTAGSLLPEPASYVTDIHQVRLTTENLSIVASGAVEGYLSTDTDQAPFRLNEYQGKLRVVTSSNNWWVGGLKNRLTILEPSAVAPGLLKTVSYLPNASRPESLGKTNELVYATRFVDDRLYAVTFRRTDPLYVVDLANASDPRITGALEVPGFSEYLHPMSNGLLLGFGKDATSTGLFQGLQLSLYDVSDAGKPRELQKVLLGRRGSESALLRHHHAFSALTQADGTVSLAIPARIHDGTPGSYSGDSTYYPWKESGLMRFELRGSGAAARLAQQPSLITHAATLAGQNLYPDAAQDGGRSILMKNGSIYIGNGSFWRQDAQGIASGPF